MNVEKRNGIANRMVAPGKAIAFLSSGQSGQHATAQLHLMSAAGPLAWKLTLSSGRALQAGSPTAWGGKTEHLAAGQRASLHGAKMNAMAASGRWSAQQETAA